MTRAVPLLRWLANRSLLIKVSLSSLVTLAALLTLSVIGWKNLQAQRQSVLADYTATFPVFETSYRISHQLAEVEANLYRLTTWSELQVSGTEMNNVLRTIDLNLQQVQVGIERLVQSGAPQAPALQKAYELYRRAATQALVLVLRDPVVGALAVRGSTSHYRKVEQLSSQVAQTNAARFRQAAGAANAQMDKDAGEFILGGLLVAACAVLASLLLARTILHPLSDLVEVIGRLQRGELQGEITGVERGDEIGRIAQSVQQLQTVLEQNAVLAEDRARRQAEVEFAATHDCLTGLSNRQAFDAFLAEKLAPGRRRQDRICLLLADLDGFKPINDAYGHVAGDKVLATLGQRYRALVRDEDMIARIGGDEFGVVVSLDHDQRDATAVARRMIEATALPIDYEGRQLRVGVSVGIVRDIDAHCRQGEMMIAADQALFLAKEQKTAAHVLFHPDMALERLGLQDKEELENAFANNEFHVLYTPVVDLRTEQPAGLSAHVIWARRDAPALEPDAYMPRVAHFGMRRTLALHVARQALRDLQRLLAQGLEPGRLSLNVDATMLASRSSFEELSDLLALYPDVLGSLTIEITDDALSGRSSAIIREHVRHLERLGISFSMEGLGSGNATFQHLREFQVDEIKIEPSFLTGLGSERAASVIIEGFLSIASGLGARVVAAGIENEAQRRFLIKRGCHLGQGPLLGPPLGFEQATEYLAAASAAHQGSHKAG